MTTWWGWRESTWRQRFWMVLDNLVHLLRLPRWLRWWVCDRFDLTLGVTREELVNEIGYSWRNEDAL